MEANEEKPTGRQRAYRRDIFQKYGRGLRKGWSALTPPKRKILLARLMGDPDMRSRDQMTVRRYISGEVLPNIVQAKIIEEAFKRLGVPSPWGPEREEKPAKGYDGDESIG